MYVWELIRHAIRQGFIMTCLDYFDNLFIKFFNVYFGVFMISLGHFVAWSINFFNIYCVFFEPLEIFQSSCGLCLGVIRNHNEYWANRTNKGSMERKKNTLES